MLPTSAGVEPATSWSPVGRASNWATEADFRWFKKDICQFLAKECAQVPVHRLED